MVCVEVESLKPLHIVAKLLERQFAIRVTCLAERHEGDFRLMAASWLNNAGRWWGRILFPPTCLGCRLLVSEPGTLCASCWKRLRFLEQPWCEVLGTPFSYDLGAGMVSADALANPPPFARARSAVAYNGTARQMAQMMKFGDRIELAPWMARWMQRAGRELLDDADFIVPVPLHRGRFFQRRFNQSAELARALCKLSGKTFMPDAVLRVRATRQQVGLGAKERAANVRGAFRVPDKMKEKINDRNLLLIDDVYTTGMTVSAVTKTLMRAGAARVDVLTFARVLPGDYSDEHTELP